jgi:hypothetical protein
MRLVVAAMGGDDAARAKLGNPATLGELHAMMKDAFAAMTPEERAADEAQNARELAALATGRRLS